MTRVKIYYNQQLSDLEKNTHEFLKREEVKQLIDVKFTPLVNSMSTTIHL